MTNKLSDIFNDGKIVNRIKERLPYLFQLAEIECSRAGKIGMQVGSLRENIVVALLAYVFGTENIETEIPITEKEVDVILSGEPISVKTITGSLSGVKLIWTVDAAKALEFIKEYHPKCDILLVNIKWMSIGNFFHIPTKVQKDVFKHLGRDRYFKLPKPGTNPRGVEITEEALTEAVKDIRTKAIPINWQKRDIDFNVYERWLKLWGEDLDLPQNKPGEQLQL